MAKSNSKALTNAERQRLYRERRNADSQMRAAYLLRKHEKYEKDKETGTRKLVKDMTPREHRKEKKAWRTRYHNSRMKRKAQLVIDKASVSPSLSNSSSSPEGPSRQKMASLKMKAQENQQLKIQVSELTKKMEASEKRLKNLRKQIERSANKSKDNKCATPRSKAKKLLLKENIIVSKTSSSVRRTLEFHFAVMSEFKEQLKKKKSPSLSSVAAGKILKKYRFKKMFEQEANVIGIRKKHYKKQGTLIQKIQTQVQMFFLRSDNSKICPGKKDTITRHKIKKQRRYMTGSLSSLYKKFVSECKDTQQPSFTTFYRLKPFWVLQPMDKDRATCLCAACENVRLVAMSLKRGGALETLVVDILLRNLSCDTNNKACMYNECKICKDKRLSITNINDFLKGKMIAFHIWEKTKESRLFKDGTEKQVLIVKKEYYVKEFEQVWELFHELLWPHKKHMYNLSSQYKHYRKVREGLTDKEVIIHIDFSENFVCKYDSEIHSAHFGASKKQLSLHTGFLSFAGDRISTFCGVSDSLDHDPFAIWGYLTPILDKIKKEKLAIKVIHFFSDGPTTQYRQKNNFYLLSSIIIEKGFTCTWNFFEAGHGKGIPDGVGATVKRAADRIVHFGNSITNASDFVENVAKHCPSVHLYEIGQKDIDAIRHAFPINGLKTVPGTMKLHQIACIKKCRIIYRDVSCVCTHGKECDKENMFSQFTFEGMVEHEDKCIDTICSNTCDVDDSIQCNTTHVPWNMRKQRYERYLDELKACETFAELVHECESQMLHMNETYGSAKCVIDTRIQIERRAVNDVPDDIPAKQTFGHLFPIKVREDGDCLPACGAVFAYGKDECPEEIRIRIIHELATHSELYLSDTYLSQGLSSVSYSCKKVFASYCDLYVPGEHNLDKDDVVRFLFEKEVMALCTHKSYMGIWQIFGLASVLKMPIISVYPKGTDPGTRFHIHRWIKPRVKISNDEAMILWTSTRVNRKSLYWCPNHFVPLVPYNKKC